MTTPARLLYEAAGSPDCPKPVTEAHGPCWVCGLPCGGSGVLVAKAVGESFTDHANVAIPAADHICVPCVWALSGRPPHTLRNWTVVWRTDRPMKEGNPKAPVYPPAHLTAKNDLTELLGVLLDPPTDGSPWFASVADSGQKHVLPFAKCNHGPQWNIRLEDEDVHGAPGEFGAVLHVAAVLYQAGFNREEIATGAPRPSKLIAAGFDFWRQHNGYINPRRGSGLLRLAVFLLRKEGIEDVIERTRRFAPTYVGSAPCAGRDAVCQLRQDPPDRLVESSAKRAAQRSSHGAKLRADDLCDGAQAPDRHVHQDERQGDLFAR